MSNTETTTETWKPVVGWEGFYEVSDQGRVRSLDRTVIFKDGRTRTWRRATRKLQPDSSGHLNVMLQKDGKTGTGYRVHRLVMAAFVGPCPADMEVCHNNGDPTDNRLANLRYDTRAANVRDCIDHGRNVNTEKRNCPRGHPLAAPNLVASSLRRGKRDCYSCHKARMVIAYRKSKGDETPELKEMADTKFAELMRTA